jgi:hypothetical protein
MRRWRRVAVLSALAGVGLALGAYAGLLGTAADEPDEGPKQRAHPSGVVEIAKAGHPLDPPGKGNKQGNGHNIQANQDSSDFPQNETAIAVNPTDSKNIIGGANDYRLGYGQSGFYTSLDGGKTWSDGVIPIPSWPDGDVPDGGGDPVVVFDGNGTAYYVGLAFERANARSALVISRSTNKGQTWSRPNFTTGDGVIAANLSTTNFSVFHDKEWATVDLSSGKAFSHTNRIYVTWTRFEGPPLPFASPIYEAHSDNGGVTWSTPKEINGSSTLCDFLTGGTVVRRCGDNQPSWPVIGPDGTVYVFFRNVDTPAENQYLMVKSTDGGTTFGAPVKVADIFDINYPRSGTSAGRRTDCAARGQQSGRPVLTNSCFRVNSFGGPAVGPDGTLYLVWSDNRNAPPPVGGIPQTDTDIFLVRSTDGGVTWSPPIRVNDDPLKNGKDQWFPWPAVGDDGVVQIVFHDRRLDAGNFLVDTWMARSSDKGQTWTNFRVTDVSSNFDFAFRGGIFVGDYSGLAVSGKNAYPFFTDARNGTAAVRHSDVFIDLVGPGNR